MNKAKSRPSVTRRLRRFIISFIAACAVLVFQVANASGALPKISNYSSAARLSSDQGVPIVILIEQSGCGYCRRVTSEYLYPMHRSGRYDDRAIFRRISLDPGESIVGPDAASISTRVFCEPYEAVFTPTLLFLDDQGRQLRENLTGYTSPDFYGHDLDQAIDEAYETLRRRELL